MVYLVLSPWLLPNAVVEGDRPPGYASRTRFADYPYAAGTQGLLLQQPELGPEPEVRPRQQFVAQRMAVQFALESGVGISDGILRNGLRARLQLPMRFELDTDWSVLREADRGGVDQVWLGREHIAVRFAEAGAVQFRSGLGGQHFCDAEGCLHGMDFTWGFDAFPGRPVVFSAEAALGNVGQAFAPSLRARLGFMLGPMELGAGWQQRWVDGIALGGPHISIGAWL